MVIAGADRVVNIRGNSKQIAIGADFAKAAPEQIWLRYRQLVRAEQPIELQSLF